MTNIKKNLPSILTVSMIALMVFLSEVFNQQEIIFPEITALTIGAWLAPKQPWQTDKKLIVILMSISSIVGVIVVRFISLSLFWKVFIGFLFTICLVVVSKTTFMPLISACILPIFMNTESIVYPIAVFIMSSIIVAIQTILQKNDFIERTKYKPITHSFKKWTIIFLCFIIISIIPIIKNQLFFIAPPLLVMFVELSNADSPARSKLVVIYLQTVFMATVSTIICKIFIYKIPFLYSKTVASIIVVAILIYIIRKSNLFFPPIGAIALLPFIISENLLIVYPLEIMIGCGLFIVVDTFVFSYNSSN